MSDTTSASAASSVWASATVNEHTRASSWNSPAEGVKAGGDWCAAIELSADTLALTIGDVSGHGLSVAEPMRAMRSSILGAMQETQVPSEILSVANAVAAGYNGDGIMVTAIVAFLDHRLRTLTYANAGHPPPLLVSKDQYTYLAPPLADLPLGIFRRHFAADYVVAVPRDGLVVLYTDGVTEHNQDPIQGEKDLAEAGQRIYWTSDPNPAREIANHFFGAGAARRDDAAILAIRVDRARF